MLDDTGVPQRFCQQVCYHLVPLLRLRPLRMHACTGLTSNVGCRCTQAGGHSSRAGLHLQACPPLPNPTKNNPKPHSWCLQCSKFHALDAFEGERHSCRESLGRHQERRRRKRNQAEGEAPASSSKRKRGAEESLRTDTHSKPSGSRPRSGKGRQGGSKGSTIAQPVKIERERKPAKQRTCKPHAAPTPPNQKQQLQQPAQQVQQAQRGHHEQHVQQQQAEQHAAMAALHSSSLAAAQASPPPIRPLQLPAAAPQLPPQQACGGVSSIRPGLPAFGGASGSFHRHAPWPALRRASMPLTSADASSSMWHMPFEGGQQAAAAAAIQQPLPSGALPGMQPEAAGLGAAMASGRSGQSLLGAASGRSSPSLPGVPSMAAEIEELLRFEGPLFPELSGTDMQSMSSSWLGSSLHSSWPPAVPSAAAGGLSGLPAAQPLQPGPGVALLASQQAQQAAQPEVAFPPRPPPSSSLREEPSAALQGPPTVPWRHHHHRHHHQQQQQQHYRHQLQQPPPPPQQQQPSLAQHQQQPAGFAGAAGLPAAAWGSGGVLTGAAVVVSPTAGQALRAVPAAPAAFAASMPPSSPTNAHLAAGGAAAAAAAAAPPARSFPGSLVTTGSGVQPWNAAWWQAY